MLRRKQNLFRLLTLTPYRPQFHINLSIALLWKLERDFTKQNLMNANKDLYIRAREIGIMVSMEFS